MAWLRKAVFLADGVSWKIVKVREVPEESLREVLVQAPEEWMDDNSPRKDWRDVLNSRAVL